MRTSLPEYNFTMRKSSLFLTAMLFCLIADCARASSVLIPFLQTGGQPSSGELEIHSSAQQTVNLSGTSGLVSGQNILVTLAASDAPVYFSSFAPAGGPLSYAVTETLSLIIGGQVFTSSVLISFSAPNVTLEPASSHIVGFAIGPLFDAIAVSVPWGTDLSNVIVRLSQDGTISGGYFVGTNTAQVDGLVAGGTRLNTLSMGLSSIPEHGAMWMIGAAALVLVRRKN